MGFRQRAKSWFTGLFGGEFITKGGVDRQLPFFLFLFLLVSVYLMWGLWVEANMAQISKNDRIIEELKIEYHEKALKLTGLDQRTRVEEMLTGSGNKTLHAPTDPPKRIVIE